MNTIIEKTADSIEAAAQMSANGEPFVIFDYENDKWTDWVVVFTSGSIARLTIGEEWFEDRSEVSHRVSADGRSYWQMDGWYKLVGFNILYQVGHHGCIQNLPIDALKAISSLWIKNMAAIDGYTWNKPA